jgi:hypothetical protein
MLLKAPSFHFLAHVTCDGRFFVTLYLLLLYSSSLYMDLVFRPLVKKVNLAPWLLNFFYLLLQYVEFILVICADEF